MIIDTKMNKYSQSMKNVRKFVKLLAIFRCFLYNGSTIV